MAFTKTPTTWLENWAEDATTITVPLATFPELTAAEADAAAGDIRKIVFAINEKLWTEWAGTLVADRPTKWTMTKSASVNSNTGVTTVQYVHTLLITTTAQEVVNEA